MAATINATIKGENANSYVTLAEANTYFETVPDSSTWTNKTDDQKNRALISATRWIDSFVFYGDRCDQGQALKWPRNNFQVDVVFSKPGLGKNSPNIWALNLASVELLIICFDCSK